MPGVIPETVNAEQRAAITHGHGPLLIVAGAGTGKTTVITQRIAWLILEQHVPIDGILSLTFTEKAATEMEERVDRLLPYGYVNLWISTFHAFCERILRAHAIDIGLPGDFRLLNQSEQWLMIRRHLDRFDLDYYRPLGNPTRFIGSLLKHFSRLEDEDIDPEEYLTHARSLRLDQGQERRTKKHRPDPSATSGDEDDDALTEAQRVHEVAQAYATYRQLLLDERSLDFGTLITWTLRLLKARPAILKKYRQQFQYILVDEFQDTNWAQYELIKLLAAPRNNLTVVGDDDQSIYKFRGASLSNILEFRKDFPTTTQVVLTKNYRSRQNILDLAYAFIQKNNPNRLEVALQGKAKRSAKVKRQSPVVSKQLTAADRTAGQIEFIHTATQEEEVRTVVERIVERKTKAGIDWKEFAILIRANDQADAFMHRLELAGVPYQFLASKGLYREPDVLDLTAYLRLLDNYHEGPALFRILNLPHFGVSPDDVVELTAYCRIKGVSLYQALIQSRAIRDLTAGGRKGIDAVVHLIKTGTQFARSHKVTEVLYRFLQDAGILQDLGKKGTEHALERIAVIRKFLDEVAAYEKLHPQTSVRDFLDIFQLKLDSGDAGSLSGTAETDADGVRIMTVHGAKGLEFAHVFLVQLVDKRFPTIERKDPIEIPAALVRETLPEGDIHLEEERRLLYVAMTRAKIGLTLSAAADYGGVRTKKPSRFLYELGFVQDETKKRQHPLAALEHVSPPHQPSPDVKFLGTKFSFSALRSYEKCPWQFRYAYVLKVPVAGNARFSYGQSLHAALQKFFELVIERRSKVQTGLFGGASVQPADPPVTVDELLGLYDQSFVDQWYQDETEREEYRRRGRQALTAFYDRHRASLPDVFAVEQPFHLKLEQYSISGKIDRIDRHGIDPETKQPVLGIVDYKSGQARPMKTEDRFQLFIYALAAQDPNILGAKVDSLSYYFMEDNEASSIPVSTKDFEKTTAWIRSSIENIRRGNFDAKPGMICRDCDFRDICEYRDPGV